MPGTVPQDLVDAVLQAIRGSNCAALFGDSWDPAIQIGTQKFFADWSDSVAYPLAVVMETGETRDYMTQVGGAETYYLSDGTLRIAVMAQSRVQTRQLSQQISRVLTDAPLVWTSGTLMYLRETSSVFIATPATAAGTPTIFVRQLTFDYTYQGLE